MFWALEAYHVGRFYIFIGLFKSFIFRINLLKDLFNLLLSSAKMMFYDLSWWFIYFYIMYILFYSYRFFLRHHATFVTFKSNHSRCPFILFWFSVNALVILVPTLVPDQEVHNAIAGPIICINGNMRNSLNLGTSSTTNVGCTAVFPLR